MRKAHAVRRTADECFKRFLSPDVRSLLDDELEEQILEALNTLSERGRVEVHQNANQFVPGRIITSYGLVDSSA